jgi:asparagine synthase (glutamine-hydrolysing)
MCGLIGIFSNSEIDIRSFNKGLDALVNRGPDFRGTWIESGVYFGHHRLTILDKESRSNQPMLSNCNQYVIVFNGEIYNYNEIKKILIDSGIEFKTNSDTEVLLQLYSCYKDKMLTYLKGMFSFIIWDRLEKKAFVARDPYGIKPLYYAAIPNGLIFSSQVKSLIATNLIDLEPDMEGQFGYWMFGNVPEPYTLFKNIRSVQSGSYIDVQNGAIQSIKKYCDIGKAWNSSDMFNKKRFKKREIQLAVQKALNESVDRHLVSDVPIGIFLSGGIDSAVISGLVKEKVREEIIGITINYDEFNATKKDETPYASEIAKHYGIKHHIRKVTKDEFLNDLPKILSDMDQPSIDGINTWYASKAAAELNLKVVLSGIGGDELFFGYKNFKRLPLFVNITRILSFLPGYNFISKIIFKQIAKIVKNNRWKYAPDWLKSIEGAWCLSRSSLSPDSAKSKLKLIEKDCIIRFLPKTWIETNSGKVSPNISLALAHIESTNYLRNQLLRDSDWSSMAHGIELRTPLVDFTLLIQLSPYLKYFNKFPTKSLLTKSLLKPLPKAILRKPKTGFSIPINEWLKGYLGDGKSWQDEVFNRVYSK